MKDPTKDEMQAFLTEAYGEEIDQFDIEEAIYWFAYEWHGGQWTNLYSALSTSPYKPSPIGHGPATDSMGQEAFEALVEEYTPAMIVER
jgi:hypothetical protein